MFDAQPLPRINELVQEVAKNKFFNKYDVKKAYYQIPLLEKKKQYTAFEANGALYQFTRLPMPLHVSNESWRN